MRSIVEGAHPEARRQKDSPLPHRLRRRSPSPYRGGVFALALLATIATAARFTPTATDTSAKIALGRQLFYDADLSIDGTMSCATCHEQHRAFADGNRTRPGVHGDAGRRNVPPLANVAFLPSLTWGDPRVTSLEAQALIPMFGEAPVEMGMKGAEAKLAARLGRDPCYVKMFAAAFPDRGGRIETETVTRALAAFQRTMVSRASPYDRGAMPEPAKRGATRFARDCAACHAGPDFTDGRFHAPIGATPGDRGLGEITGRPADDGHFRTPTLRNIAVTAPYLHDGSAPTIPVAIARHRNLPPIDAAAMAELTAFLDQLTDRRFFTYRRLALPKKRCDRRL
ncbi:cytochrome c peroxidase [Sphingomonas naphthae]|uniref:Cytochrome c peroxidase n=1 Tax=Sphingomonas naphthae TaxID=1813468 RepID=A0ABY7TLQ8_9SPHN|nr:cytochrome c peroxidase [Sphingomonas naphthae]WCT73978.1 cytochrome c peroxidase [Sphingomonas naphthae]